MCPLLEHPVTHSERKLIWNLYELNTTHDSINFEFQNQTLFLFSIQRCMSRTNFIHTKKKQSLGLPSYRFRILDLVTRQLWLHTVKHYESVKHEQTLTFQRAQTIVSWTGVNSELLDKHIKDLKHITDTKHI